jgi:hypothetical protein
MAPDTAARTPISDALVARALRAYESLPDRSGREARMRAALEAVVRKPQATPETEKENPDGTD